MEKSPPPAFEDEARCRIYAREEIVAILRELRDAHVLATAHFSPRDFIITTVLEVQPGIDALLLDYGADRAANNQLLRAPRLQVQTQHNHIQIRFACGPAQVDRYQNRPAFRLPLPPSLVRLQRREFFRLRIPLAESVQCHLPPQEHLPPVRGAIRVMDISCGGVALLDLSGKANLETSRTYRNCRIELPGGACVVTDMEVRHVRETRSPAGECFRHCGCRFVGITPAKTAQIQRFIYLQERQRLVEE